MSFHCRTCEVIAKALLHTMHSTPAFQLGQRHSRCREIMRLIKEFDRKVMEHSTHCRKESNVVPRIVVPRIVPFKTKRR
jgi:hypothetical protein